MNGQENGSTKTYVMLQVLLAVVSVVTILAGSLYFEKYQEEWITSLLVTLTLGVVYGRVLKQYARRWKVILCLHLLMMLLITVGFLLDGFYKPIAFAPVIIGSFLTPEAGLAAAVYYGVTAVLYTMETGELLMLYLVVAGVGIYFLKDFFASDSVAKKAGGMLVLFVLQVAGTGLFRFYMYRETELSIALIGAAVLAALTGIFSVILPMISVNVAEDLEEGDLRNGDFESSEETDLTSESFSGSNQSNQNQSKKMAVAKEETQKERKKRGKKKTGQSLLLDENSELFQQLKANPELYQHSQTVARIAEGVAVAVDADRMLTRAGAMYHDIGKLADGEDYVTEGVALCRENHVLDRVIRLIEEHNVNYKIPTSKEAAAVMLADTIVSTMEFNQKKGKETDPELLVEKIFQVRKDQGSLKAAKITDIELELMEEAMKKEVGVL